MNFLQGFGLHIKRACVIASGKWVYRLTPLAVASYDLRHDNRSVASSQAAMTGENARLFPWRRDWGWISFLGCLHDKTCKSFKCAIFSGLGHLICLRQMMLGSDVCMQLNIKVKKKYFEFVWILPLIICNPPNNEIFGEMLHHDEMTMGHDEIGAHVLPLKLAALWQKGVSPRRNVAIVSKSPCTMPYCRNWLH